MTRQLISGKAYQLFLDELTKHLASAENALDHTPSEDEAKELGRVFHTLRGGAGFLGFPEIAQAAADIEQLMVKSQDTMVHRVEEARDALKELERLADRLPSPKRT